MADPAVSVVVPLFNEEPCVDPLVRRVRRALGEGEDWELVLVDDGSADGTASLIRAEAGADPRVRPVLLARNYGQSTALQAGFDHARGRVIVTMDGDLQNDPDDISRLLDAMGDEYDLVSGYRLKRQDAFLTRKIPSWVANRIIRLLTGVRIRDNGCSLKAYRRAVLSEMRLYSDMHRFIPALAVATSGARVLEIPVRHHARTLGESKYGLSRVAKVLADLATVTMLRSFRLRPLRFLGSAALASLGLGSVAGAAALAHRVGGSAHADSVVLPGVCLLFVALTIFLLMLGLVAEVEVYGAQRRAGAPARSVAREVLP